MAQPCPTQNKYRTSGQQAAQRTEGLGGVLSAPEARRRVRGAHQVGRGFTSQLKGRWELGPGGERPFRVCPALPRPAHAPFRSSPPPLSPLARSLRMQRGKSTWPTSRHRAPQRPPPRTGLMCTSCLSLRSRCPWPSSLGAPVSCLQGPGGAAGRAQGSGAPLPGRGGEGLACAPSAGTCVLGAEAPCVPGMPEPRLPLSRLASWPATQEHGPHCARSGRRGP